MGIVKKKVDHLFSIADHLNPDELLQKFNEIMKTGEKAVELSENKIQVANNLQKLMQKYMKTLDIDLLKFQANLEEKYGAIAEEIKKRVLDSDESHTTIPQKNEYHLNKYVFEGQQDNQSSNDEDDEEVNVENSSPECLKMNSTLQELNMTSLNVPQEEINSEKKSSSSPSSDILINNEIVVESNKIKKSNTKKKEKEEAQDTTLGNENKSELNKRYCLCNEVAYDKMIACDNKSCPFEWFHFECVGISQQPRGNWYCTSCRDKMKKKSRKRSSRKTR